MEHSGQLSKEFKRKEKVSNNWYFFYSPYISERQVSCLLL
jgi:hypothetical protein